MSKIQKKRKIQEGGGFSPLKLGLQPLATGLAYPLTKVIDMGAGKIGKDISESVKEGILNPIEGSVDKAVDKSPFADLKKKFNDDENKTSEQLMLERYNANSGVNKKSFVKQENMMESTEYWDMLYDEPCWINPATGTFDLSNAFSKLWCNWYMTKDPAKLLGEVTVTPKISVDEGGLRKAMAEKFPEDFTSFRGFSDINEAINDAVDRFKGDESKEGVGVDTKGDTDELARNLGLDKEVIDEYVIIENNLLENMLSPMDMVNMMSDPDQNSGDGNSLVSNKDSCNYKKWWFCFFFKFLTGPVGLLILKIMPYFMRFLMLMYRTIMKFFMTLTAGFQGSNPLSKYLFGANPNGGRRFPYKDKYGKLKVHKVFTKDIIWQYLGLVIPWGIIDYDAGKYWGNGEFGKFILSLTILSAGIIFMGGISVFVFLCVFMFYCAKTLAMFGDNITEKKKN